MERPASEAVKTANLVIIATPILTMPEVFREIAPALKPGAVVTDVGSTKAEVLKWAEQLLPDTVHFVGGHPMAGKEVAGIDNAEASLFEGWPDDDPEWKWLLMQMRPPSRRCSWMASSPVS